MLKALFGSPPEERAQQAFPFGPWNNDIYAPVTSGMVVNDTSSLQLLTVYGASTLIADTIATLPRDVFRNDGTDNVSAPTPKWLEQPNPNCDIVELLTQTLLSLLLDGNAYWVYGVDRNLLAAEIYCLDPTKVDVRDREHTTYDPPISSGRVVEYYVNGELFRGRLTHIKGVTRPGCLKGMSPVEAARQAIGLGLAAQAYAGSFYKNGTTLSGVIQTEADLTPDQARDLVRSFSHIHGGVNNAHLPGVLDNGASWQQIAVTPEQGQFLQSREFTAAEICAQLFLLDPSMLGIAINRGQNLTYANLEQRGIHLVQFTLLRWIIRLERAINSLLPKSWYVKFNVDALIRADLKSRYESYAIGLGAQPFLKLNEVREFEELPDIPGGDTITTPTPAPTLAPFPTNGHVGATQ